MAICGRSEDYVHLNPVRAKLLGAENRLLEYPWSSFGWYLAGPAHRPEWLRVDRLLGEHGILEDTSGAAGVGTKDGGAPRRGGRWSGMERNTAGFWCLGGPEFKVRLLERMEGKLGEHHAGELKRESTEAKGERILAEELRRLSWKEARLEQELKSDPVKLVSRIIHNFG